MSEEPRANARDDQRLDEESLRRLFAEAGPRPELPEAALAQIRRGLEGAWRERQEERSRAAERSEGAARRRRWAVAAVFVVGVAGVAVFEGWFSRPLDGPTSEDPPTAIALGSVDAVFGQLMRENASGERTALNAGDRVVAGDVLKSEGPSRARLRLSSGHGLRLDHESRIRLEAADRLALSAGAVYLESGPDRTNAVEVAAAGAVTREIGTRFEVRLLPSSVHGDGQIAQALSVRVREGAVVTERGTFVARSEAGMQHVLQPTGEVATTPIATHGPEWAWVAEIAAPFVVEGSSLRQYLDWVAAEEGLRLAFEKPAEEAVASTITLHGTLGNLSPAASVEVMLPAAGFEGRLDAGVLTVRRADR